MNKMPCFLFSILRSVPRVSITSSIAGRSLKKITFGHKSVCSVPIVCSTAVLRSSGHKTPGKGSTLLVLRNCPRFKEWCSPSS